VSSEVAETPPDDQARAITPRKHPADRRGGADDETANTDQLFAGAGCRAVVRGGRERGRRRIPLFFLCVVGWRATPAWTRSLLAADMDDPPATRSFARQAPVGSL